MCRWSSPAAAIAILLAAGAAPATAQVELRGEPRTLDRDGRRLGPDARGLAGGGERATTGRPRRLSGRVRALGGGRPHPRRVVREVIRFRFDRSKVRSRPHDRLERLTDRLAARSVLRIRVDGHTDGFGEPHYNVGLSRRRALRTCAVLRDLFDRPGLACKPIPHGARDPEARNMRPDGSDDPDGRKRNRRAEIAILVR